MPPLSHLTSCNSIKSNLYFYSVQKLRGGRGSFKLWKKTQDSPVTAGSCPDLETAYAEGEDTKYMIYNEKMQSPSHTFLQFR